MIKILLVLLVLSQPAFADNWLGNKGGTECATAPCNLNTSTTLNTQGICLADGTNCPGGGAGTGVINSGSAHQSTYYAAGGTTVSGTSALTTDNTNVGVGTINPTSLLDVKHLFNVLSGGNVGVGSPNPAAKLDVAGTVNLTGFKLSTSPTNGYVLTADASGNGTWVAPTGGITYPAGTGIAVVTSGNSWGTTLAAPTGAIVGISDTQTLTNKNLTSGTNTFPTLNQNTTGTSNNVTGTVAIANGGTGQTTQQAAIDALAGGTTSANYLRANGSHVVLSTIQAADVPTLNQNTTGTASTVTTAAQPSITSVGTLTSLLVTGNVGIGSPTPGQKLDVTGTIRTTGFTLSTAPTNGFVLVSDANGNGTWSANNGASQWTTTGSNIFYSTGNVGIGTSTALTAPLVVNGQVVTLGTGNTLLNVASGNVGIGSPNPGTLLDVAGTARMTGFDLTTNAINGYVLVTNNIGIGTWMSPSSIGATGGGGGGSGTVSAGTTNREAVYTGSTTVGSGIITDNGTNIGIGSATPGQVLDVNGAGRFGGTGTTNFTSNVGINAVSAGAALDVEGTLSTALFQGSGPGTGVSTSAVGIGTAHPGTGYVEINQGTQGGATQWAFAVIGNNNGTPTTGANNANILVHNTNSLGYAEFDAENNDTATGLMGIGMSGTTAALAPGGAYWYTGGAHPIYIQPNYTINGNNPAIAFMSNLNVGIGTAQPSQLLEVGHQTLDITSTGNIGIGTINPEDQIKVTAAVPTIIVNSTSSSGIAAFGALNSSGDEAALVCTGTGYAVSRTCGVLSSAGRSFNIGSLSGSIFETVDANGNLGVGQTSPAQKLDVSGTTRTTGLTLTSVATGTQCLHANSSGVITGTGSDCGSGGSGTISSGTINNLAVYTGTTTVGSGIVTDNGTNVGVGTASPSQELEVGHQAFDVMSNGNIGIGTINPVSPINVRYNAVNNSALQMTNTNSSGYSSFRVENSSGLGFVGIATGSGYAIPSTVGILTDAGNNLSFGNSSGSIFQTIDSNGNVGIGSITPGLKLDVNGSVRLTNLVVGTSVGVTNTATTTCGCKVYKAGICMQLGTCS